jgi:hypothetical protein
MVATGTPGNLSLVACGHGSITTPILTQSVYVLVVDDVAGAGNGGTLVMEVAGPTARPDVTLTVSPKGRFVSKTGALLQGTLTCPPGASGFIFGAALQNRGRPAAVSGGFGLGFFDPLVCNGAANRWTAEVFPSLGDKFTAGPTFVSVNAFICYEHALCHQTEIETVVDLRR